MLTILKASSCKTHYVQLSLRGAEGTIFRPVAKERRLRDWVREGCVLYVPFGPDTERDGYVSGPMQKAGGTAC